MTKPGNVYFNPYDKQNQRNVYCLDCAEDRGVELYWFDNPPVNAKCEGCGIVVEAIREEE